MKRLLAALVFIFIYESIAAQDTIVLLSGRRIIASSIDLKDYTIAYRTKPGSKLKKIDPFRVFSIAYHDKPERIVYQRDSLDTLEYSIPEMRLFIKGEEDAHRIYKNTPIRIGGVALGAGAGLLAFYGLVVPPLYATVVGAFSPNVNRKMSFRVKGDAATNLGITTDKYLNEVTGNIDKPLVKKGQALTINHSTIKFEEDSPVDTVVSRINEKFKCHRVVAENSNEKLRLYRVESATLLQATAYREGFQKKVRDYKIRNAMLSGLAGFIAGSLTYYFVFKDDGNGAN